MVSHPSYNNATGITFLLDACIVSGLDFRGATQVQEYMNISV